MNKYKSIKISINNKIPKLKIKKHLHYSKHSLLYNTNINRRVSSNQNRIRN